MAQQEQDNSGAQSTGIPGETTLYFDRDTFQQQFSARLLFITTNASALCAMPEDAAH